MTIHSRALRLVVLAITAVAVASAASAQGLAEAARKEEARRKTITKPAKVFTNSSLKEVPGEATPATSSPGDPAAGSGGGAANPPAASGQPATSTPETDSKRTPEYWKQRIQQAEQERDNNALMLQALQSRVNGLWADFTARDNPVERAAIAGDRQKALDEMARRQAQQSVLEKAIADIQDEARRLNVPPGWLR